MRRQTMPRYAHFALWQFGANCTLNVWGKIVSNIFHIYTTRAYLHIHKEDNLNNRKMFRHHRTIVAAADDIQYHLYNHEFAT